MPLSLPIKNHRGGAHPLKSFRMLAGGLSRRLLIHVLPLLLMIAICCWIALKADALIQRSKQGPAIATEVADG